MAATALITTTTVCIICIVRFPMEVNEGQVPRQNLAGCDPKHLSWKGPPHKTPTTQGFFTAFGSIMFAFGGAAIFPSIQADMVDRSKFKYAAILALSSKNSVRFSTFITTFPGWKFMALSGFSTWFSCLQEGAYFQTDILI